MAVLHTSKFEREKPAWVRFTNYGLHIHKAGDREANYHYHDANEYLVIIDGRGRFLMEGTEYDLLPGDCVCMPVGAKHQLLESDVDTTLIWIYDELVGQCRSGHIVADGNEPDIEGCAIFKISEWKEKKPSWVRFAAMGMGEYPKGGVDMPYHYNDCVEYYFCAKGSYKMLVDDREETVKAGEVLPVRTGYNHKVVEALEDSITVGIQEELEGQKREGMQFYEKEGWLPIDQVSCTPVMPKTAEYGIGIIGVGRIANMRQIPSYINAGLEVVAVCDINEENLKNTQERWGIEKGFTDYKDLIALPEVKIVDIQTQSWVRPPMIEAAAKAGKHIICEKPFARSMEEAHSIVAMADRAGVKMAVHQPTRWYYMFSLAKKLVKLGYIGEPYFFFDDRCHNLDTAYYEWNITRWHVSIDDFLPIEWGAHPFDIARWMFEKEPLKVYASATRMPGQNFKSEMAGNFTADFPSPLKAAVVLNMASQPNEYHWKFRIEGTHGAIRGSLDAPYDKPWLECYSRKLGGGWHRLEWEMKEAVDEAHGGPMYEFINSIAENREAENGAHDNINTMRFCHAMLRSMKEGRIVTLDEMK